MTRYLSKWVLPIVEPPVRLGRVDVERGRVVDVGPRRESREPGVRQVDLGSVVILPALVNAHTHLELSGLRGAAPPAPTLPDWVTRLMACRGTAWAPDRSAIAAALAEGRAAGTGLIGDIGNTLAAVPVLEAAGAPAHVFREVLAFPADGAVEAVEAAAAEVDAVGETLHVRIGLAAHAPYSVGPDAFVALDRIIRRSFSGPRCIHLAESPEEIEFLRSGGGPWRALLEHIGRWNPDWAVPGCGPVEYLERQGWLAPGLIAVHGVQLTDTELARLAASGAALVTCPRSNVWTGVGLPPIDRFLRSGVRLAVGTDSLASVPDLNLFAELALMRECAPAVSARRLIECATAHGAAALGFAADFGRVAPGARSALIAVQVPAGVDDVEEYLVGGIDPDQVTWLDDHTREPAVA